MRFSGVRFGVLSIKVLFDHRLCGWHILPILYSTHACSLGWLVCLAVVFCQPAD